MKTIKIILGVSIFSFLGLFNGVSATKIDFDYSKLQNGQIYKVEILATPENLENAVSVKLETSGLRIINYTSPQGWLIVVPDCSNGLFIEDNKVCASLAKEKPIEEGESLGTLEFKVLDVENLSIKTATDNVYTDGEILREYKGTILGAQAEIENQNSAETENSYTEILIPAVFGGLILLGLGGIFMASKFKK